MTDKATALTKSFLFAQGVAGVPVAIALETSLNHYGWKLTEKEPEEPYRVELHACRLDQDCDRCGMKSGESHIVRGYD